MGTVRVTERIAAPFTGVTVNREGGVIGGVLVCGFDSANGRRYPADVLRKAAGLYEGRPVNVDHADRATCDRRLGWLSNVRAGADGRPRADLNVLRTHPLADAVFEAAERNPSLFGMSHVALCKTSRGRDGVEVIEAIESVESVDLVADPATTKGLHESRTGGRTVTLAKLIEWAAPRAKLAAVLRLKALSEMDGMDALDVPEPAPEADTDPDAAISGAFEQAGIAVWKSFVAGDIDMAQMVAKLKDIAKAHGKLADGGESDPPAEGGDSEGENKESKTVDKPDDGKAIREAIAVCRTVGFKGFDADDLDLIASAPAERREAVAKRLMGTAQQPAAAEKPKAAGRAGAAKLDEAAAVADKPPTDGKKFAEWVS